MPKSIRIRTEPGVDRNINVKIDQDFDSLEILSLKLRQEDLYTQESYEIIQKVAAELDAVLPRDTRVELDSEEAGRLLEKFKKDFEDDRLGERIMDVIEDMLQEVKSRTELRLYSLDEDKFKLRILQHMAHSIVSDDGS